VLAVEAGGYLGARSGSRSATLRRMHEDPDTQELRLNQLERELAERQLAEAAPEEEEAAQHERRAEKANYLREKLGERAQSEREAAAAAEEGHGEGSG
jgi:hypothetical protein